MKRKMIAMLLSLAMVGSMLTGCSVSTGSSDDDKKTEDDAKGEESADAEDGTVTKSDPNMKDREEITLWFWGAEPYAQEAMQGRSWLDKYNASQDKYQLGDRVPTVRRHRYDHRPCSESGT